MNNRGSPDIVERGKKTQFRCGETAAVEAQKKSVLAQNKNRAIRNAVRILGRTTLHPGRAFKLEKLKGMDQIFNEEGELKENLTVNDLISLRIVHGAIQGDPECRRLFLELSDEIGINAKKEDDGDTTDTVTVIIDV